MKRIFSGSNESDQPERKLKANLNQMNEVYVTSKGILGDNLKFTIKKREEQKERVVFKLDLLTNQDSELAPYKGKEFKVIMKGNGLYEEIKEGSIVKVLGTFTKEGLECNLDKYGEDIYNGYIILDPDKYINATTLSYCFDCILRAFINMAFPTAESKVRFPLKLGTMVHNLFDHCIANRKHLENVNEEHVDRSIKENYLDLYAAAVNDAKSENMDEEMKKTIEKTKMELMHYLDNIKKMVKENVIGKKPLEGNEYMITNLIATEQKFFSRRFGIIGQIDVIVEVEKQGSSDKSITYIELKSGRDSDQPAHLVQCGIYRLLLHELGCLVNEKGFLVYLKTLKIKTVSLTKADYNEIIKYRNSLVFLQTQLSKGKFDFKQPTRAMCRFCSCKDYYKIYSKFEKTDIEDLFDLDKEELTTTDKYFKEWNDYIALQQYKAEKNIANSSRKEIGVSEEKNLEIESIKKEDRKVILVMKKAGEIDAGINKGSYVDISCSDNPLITLGNGSLTSKNVSFNNGIITTISISLSELGVLGIIEDKFTITDLKAKKWSVRCNPQSSATYGIMRWALTTFCNKEELKRQRELIIDVKQPSKTKLNLTVSQITKKYSSTISSLNSAQVHAILKAINCSEYQLVLGVNNSGKSCTIAALLEILALEGHTVLYMANTDTRIDKTLTKLIERKVKFHHISSNKDYVGREMREYIGKYLPINNPGSKEYFEAAMNIKIIAATSYNLTKDIIRLRNFDYCVIDNASQMIEPICLGGVVLGKKFVMFASTDKEIDLVLDTSKEKKVHSLFIRLAEAYPENMAKLCKQYSMNSKIMEFINCAVYGGLMEQGLKELENLQLSIPKKRETYCSFSS